MSKQNWDFDCLPHPGIDRIPPVVAEVLFAAREAQRVIHEVLILNEESLILASEFLILDDESLRLTLELFILNDEFFETHV